MTFVPPKESPSSRATEAASVPIPPRRPFTVPGLRWWIVALLFGAAVLNYVDRQTLSALAPTLQRDLTMDDRAYANVVNLFLVAYTVGYLVSGRLADRLGTRWSMVLFVSWWSVANALTAMAQGVASLSVFRFLLGLGEAGVWPVASKVVSEWFPARERAFAIGLYTMGATVGATLAPSIVIPLATFAYDQNLPWVAQLLGDGTGWRLAFIATGLAGLVWLLPWAAFYRAPRESRWISQRELGHIENLDTAAPAESMAWTWSQVLSCRAVWLLLFSRLLTDPVWYFYQFWFAKYLSSERQMAQGALTVTWVIYAAAGIGSLVGGWLSGHLVKRGQSPVQSRLWVMTGCACIMPLSPWVASVSSVDACLVLAVVSVFAAVASLINLTSLVVDLIPKGTLGTVFSVVATGSTLGGIAMNTLVANMLATTTVQGGGFLDEGVRRMLAPLLTVLGGKGYDSWFLIMAVLHPLAVAILWLGIPRDPAERRKDFR